MFTAWAKYSNLITWHDLAKYRPSIGPNSWGYWRLLIPFQGRLFDAGETHDFNYSYWTEEDREDADFQFYEWCMKVSWKNIFAIFFASVYYVYAILFMNQIFNSATRISLLVLIGTLAFTVLFVVFNNSNGSGVIATIIWLFTNATVSAISFYFGSKSVIWQQPLTK